MRYSIRNIVAAALLVAMIFGLIFAQEYSWQAQVDRNPSLNCPDGWQYGENQDAQMCVKAKVEGDSLMISTLNGASSSDVIFISDPQ